MVSERGEQWSPQTEPERIEAIVASIRSSSPPATATLLVATGNTIATACQCWVVTATRHRTTAGD